MRFRTQLRNRSVQGAAMLAMVVMFASLLSIKISAQEPEPGVWKIMRAQYGWRDRQTDGTRLVGEFVARGGVNGRVWVNNETMGGDPAVSRDKTLRIIARNQQNQEREFLYREGAAIDVEMLVVRRDESVHRDEFDDRPRGDSRHDDRRDERR